ncbi:MAG: hypothetical protein AAFY26_26290 [Cyanobacteria bacterium J06638_22]
MLAEIGMILEDDGLSIQRESLWAIAFIGGVRAIALSQRLTAKASGGR